MAEFLIYDRDHWMDKLNQEEYDKLMTHPHGAEKFLARYQRGDIVEVRSDGFYTSTLNVATAKWPFRVVVVEGLKPDNKYAEPIMQGDTIIKRRRYNISDGATKMVHTVSKIEDITLTDKNG